MKLFAYDGPLARLTDRLCSLLLLNLAFILTSVPIVTVGVSTAALDRCLLDIASGETDGVLKRYFGAFKSNFKKSMLLSLCIAPFLAFAIGDTVLFFFDLRAGGSVGSLALLLPPTLLLCVLSFLFPLQARFENTVPGTLKNAVLLALGRLPTALLMSVISLTPLLVPVVLPDLFVKWLPVWLMFGFSGPGLINAFFLNRIFAGWMPEKPDMNDPESEGELQNERHA